MKKEYIALLDSGIGGISVLNELLKLLPNERYLYYGDNDNAPYGNRSIRELMSITFKNVDEIKRYDVKVLIIACNTLSTTLLDVIAGYSGIPTFGVFPPVEQPLMNREKTLLLSTNRTAMNFKNAEGLFVLGLKRLARDIEYNMFNLGSIKFSDYLCDDANISFGNGVNFGSIDSVVLGCTHFEFIKKQIIDHFRPQKIFKGQVFTAKKVYNFLKNIKSLENNKRNEILFIGKNAKLNQKFFEKSGQMT